MIIIDVILIGFAALWLLGAAMLLWLYFRHGQGDNGLVEGAAWIVILGAWPISFPLLWAYDGIVLFIQLRRRR